MNLWNTALKAATDAEEAIEAEAGSLTGDQKLQLAQTFALLAIGQELSNIHHGGIAPEYDPS